MNPLQKLYLIGLNFDRKLKQRTKLAHPVISVGNVSVGGRAKTPMVIELCDLLKDKYQPVVLTRGYARKVKKDVWLLPEVIRDLQHLSVEESGDEAVEIFLKAKVPVLISPDRAAQAQKYSQQHKDEKIVYILDDGFQHWALERDFDLVMVNDHDYQDSVLPTGRLREPMGSLERADLVLALGKDVKKKMEVTLAAKGLDPSVCVAITTRAGSQEEYQVELKKQLGFAVDILALRDHMDAGELQENIYRLEAGKKQLLLGMKEAVKLLGPQELVQKREAFYPLKIKDREFEVYLVSLRLDWDKEKFLQAIAKKRVLQ